MIMAGHTNIPSLNESLGFLQEELSSLKGVVELLGQNKEAAREVVNASQKVSNAAINFLQHSNVLIEKIEKVDFPNRLDKLDTAVSALHVGFQTLQGRLDGLERNVKDDIRGMNSEIQRLDQSIQKVNQSIMALAGETENLINQHSDKFMKLTWVLLSFLIVNFGAMVFLLLRH